MEWMIEYAAQQGVPFIVGFVAGVIATLIAIVMVMFGLDQ